MMFTADQLIAHAVGDYVLQSDWMANEKTKKSVAALAHVATYFLPFLFLTQSWKALVVIVTTHFFIDRFRLARFVCWVKNFLSPPTSVGPKTGEHAFKTGFYRKGQVAEVPYAGGERKVRRVTRTWESQDPGYDVVELSEHNVWWHPWKECVGTGYHKDRPVWMAVWLMIIADNLMHVTINALALRYL